MPLAAFPKCYLDALCNKRTMTVEKWIDDACTQLDIDGLEFYSGFTPVGDAAALKNLRKRVESHGKTIPMLCCSPDFIKPDKKERAAEIDAHKKRIEAAAGLGAKYCRVLSGQRRPDVAIPDGVRYAAECINALIPFAKQTGVVLILENHYKDGSWSYPEFAQKREVFLQLLNAIEQSPNFGVNYDPSNCVIAGEDPIAMLEAVKSRVVTMHASDRYFEGGTAEDLRKIEANPHTGYAGILKHGVVGKGLNDYDKIFSILKSVGFNGWVSIEDGEDPVVGMEHLRLSAEFLRAKMKAHGLS
ncbi:MAG TPA: sugar phosphate isomerase/epimerase family protein [Planctomycetota bacterium]|nr:sugar phosphate isomerase/epimerase family protein [Planctomycetota bacterium]